MISRSAFPTLLAIVLAASANALASSTGRQPNPVVKVLANGMTLLKPVFAAEAKIQAAVLGAKVDAADVSDEISQEIKSNDIVLYTYGLSPFSTEALAMVESSGYNYDKIELGAEWFLLGGKNSVKRVALSEKVENGATSLPKIFVKGECIGGCAELAELVESGELDSMIQPKSTSKKGLFSFL